ncbi:zinc carboxypeptidase [Nocardioides guangzhouensis]|uniref:Zinc carboxypeptidase n=1 Tax=Nocardioides guangzhouensis TaxID=2497878 RepID=A0A4Q4ZN36_9ACTN|nr:M14 family metallopeptidase [Nocardioides guangzhouensis]RYP88894.1 zinc carboxypeptidase [Nocardioides guangzhouensis]
MRRSLIAVLVTFVVAALCVGLTSASGSPPAAPKKDPLDAYTATVAAGQVADLAAQGLDVSGQRPDGAKVKVDLVLDKGQAAKLRGQGVDLALTRVKGGKTVRQFAAAEAVGGYTVWKSYDEPGGIRDQMYAVARDNPSIAKLVKVGTTHQGREILAIKLTQGARGQADGSRPAVLFSATQHAREWIATEVSRRLMNYYVDGWRSNDRDVRKLLQSTELWFMPVLNPDGYQYTFDTERLWRKNLRDNNGDGQITVGDGVDPNRNFPSHWGYDNEGSSPITSSDTYRGPSEASEPETQAMVDLFGRIKFEFMVNYHSNGRWLLYNDGWQIGTPTADDPIYYAMSGNLDKPAIEGFHPGLSSDVLYVTNGEIDGYAQEADGTLAWTPELSPGCDGCGFVFPDDPALVQEEFQRNLPFAKSVADSATTPDNPKTVTGIKTKPFYVESEDAYKSGLPAVQLSFDKSYGDPQTVAVLAKRSLGAVTVKYRINGGAVQSAGTSEWDGGSRYGMTSTYYHQVRGTVTGTDPGDTVDVWFEGGGQSGGNFTYKAVSETGHRVLVVAAEDYTGASPVQTPGPHYVDYYTDALAANGQDADVWDVDKEGRTAPDALGVLSHYDAVIWETGDDLVTRTAGRGAGNVDRLALDLALESRAYMNEGGKVLFTGDVAGGQYTGATVGTQRYDPKGEEPCPPAAGPFPPGWDPRRCLPLRGSGDNTNDVIQYWFGGYVPIPGDGIDDNGDAFGLTGTDEPFDGFDWTLNGGDSADNQDITSSFVSTSGILPPDEFKQFESWPSARWDKPGGPFAPHTGDHYVYSQIADVSYKRLTKEVAVPAGGGNVSFWTSYNTEADWDFLFVEARTAGGTNWTTLPDANGHTSQATGESCASGWRDLHPQLNHYQSATCAPTGSTGAWNAASGNSAGWQQWRIDLSGYAGQTVEVSIAYASDWGTQGVGVFLDDITEPNGTTASFETGLDGWAVTGPPEGSGPNANNFVRTDASGFPVGATISTPHSLLLGFGFEGITTAAQRNEVMARALDHLLD